MQNTGTPPVVDSGGGSAWVREDTKGVSPEVRLSSHEADYCFPFGWRMKEDLRVFFSESRASASLRSSSQAR